MADHGYPAGSTSGPLGDSEPAPPRRPRWTVMIFMGADSIQGNQPLDEAVVNDLQEIEYAVCGPGLDVFVEVVTGERPDRRLSLTTRPVPPVRSAVRPDATRQELSTADDDTVQDYEVMYFVGDTDDERQWAVGRAHGTSVR